MKKSKRVRAFVDFFKRSESYSLEEALQILKKAPSVRFDETVDLSLCLGVDPKKSDQKVKGSFLFPHGTGMSVSVVVLAKDENVQLALDAGAELAGDEEVVDKILSGWVDFSVLIATPDMMRSVGKLGKVLGPRGLMPTLKGGTVSADVARAVKEAKMGKISFQSDKNGVINVPVGKLSFSAESLKENVNLFIEEVVRLKPPAAKNYLNSMVISSTMGPGVRLKSDVAADV